MIENEKILATALYLALHDAHPVYPSTAKWNGGVGGAAVTSHCSFTQGQPTGDDWVPHIETLLRDWLSMNPDFDLAAAAEYMKTELTKD